MGSYFHDQGEAVHRLTRAGWDGAGWGRAGRGVAPLPGEEGEESEHTPAAAAQTAVGAEVALGQVSPQVGLHGLHGGRGELAVLAAQHAVAHHGVAGARRCLQVGGDVLKQNGNMSETQEKPSQAD